jgi:hypothetical protein
MRLVRPRCSACALAHHAHHPRGSSPSSSAAGQQSAAQSGPGAGRGGLGGGPPATFGTLAEITGNSLEVQNQTTGQVTVTFSAGTGFSQTRTVPLSALKVGDCVSVVAARTSAAPSATAAPPATPSSGAPPTSFTATSVQLSAPVNGSCALTGFGGGGTRPSGSGRPTGSRTAQPSGAPSGGNRGGFGGFGALASGTIVQLSAETMLVRTIPRGQQAGTLDAITLTSATSYSQTEKTTSSALKIGECVTATGTTNSTGTVAATRIALSTAGANGCSSGFGRRPGPAAQSTGA